ncbi:MAG: hypothetical protein Q8L93_09670 [Rhodocyclaceae bacterium]|nr:hypothetical protein [Rhodocyclaceae bacterium]
MNASRLSSVLAVLVAVLVALPPPVVSLVLALSVALAPPVASVLLALLVLAVLAVWCKPPSKAPVRLPSVPICSIVVSLLSPPVGEMLLF